MLLGDERAAAVKAAKAAGDCGEWSYTPKATGASVVKRQWVSELELRRFAGNHDRGHVDHELGAVLDFTHGRELQHGRSGRSAWLLLAG